MDSDTLHQLLKPEAFTHPTGHILLRETHISWVVLSGDYAYKIKKPVNFGFLDFSTVSLRQHFCNTELALNRRFAPELYLEVVPITADAGGPRFAGEGPVIDYAVKMRQFDENQLLDNIAARQELGRPLVRALAREIAHQQAQAPRCHPLPGSNEPGSARVLLAAMNQNFSQVRDYPLAPAQLEQLTAVEQWTQQNYSSLLSLLEQRVESGQVIDGHGDAHLGNIALIDEQVRLFDCIEFNPSLRVLDSTAEIALLSMDLEARGHAPESHWLLADYLEYGGDYECLALLNLYRCYYAMVRAKVALLREQSHHDLHETEAYQDFCRYLAQASKYCETPGAWLAITHGVSGSGKSSVADKLVAASGALRIRSDVERKRLFGLAPEQRSDPADEKKLYSTEMSTRTFERLAQLAEQAVNAGFPVIVDATFLHRKHREPFGLLAERLSIPFVIIDCKAPQQELQRRLLEREKHGQDASEAGVRVMESQLQVDQPPEGQELAALVEVRSGEPGDILWGRLLVALQQQGAQ